MKTRNKNTGSAQAARLPKSLEKDYFRLDDRSAQDMIVAAHEYARLLRYHNLNNVAEGDWSCFWRADYITLLAAVAALDTDELRWQYESIDTKFGEALEDYDPDENPAQTDPGPGYYKQLLQRLRDMAEQLERQYLDLKAAQLPLADTLLQLIRRDNCCDDQELQGTLARLIRLHKAGDDQLSYQAYQVFFTDDNRWGVAGKKAWDGLMTAADLDRVQLRAIFVTFMNTFVYLKNKAQQAYDDALTVRPQVHPPHVALFLTFLNLFKHLQDDLNDLTTEHLDFYYEKVLGFERRPAQPDQAYLVFTLAKEFNDYMVNAGTALLGGAKNRFYETLDNWKITQAKLEEIKNWTILDGKLKAAPIANSADGLGGEFEKGKAAEWRLFGDADSNPDGDYGIAIAGPVLWMEEGTRTITLDFKGPDIIDLKEICFSTEEGWTKCSDFGLVPSSPVQDQIIVILPVNFPPVVPVALSKTPNIFPHDWPVMKIFFKPESIGSILNTPFSLTTLSVDVIGLEKTLIIETPLGVQEPGKEIQLFGSSSEESSECFVGSNEISVKALDNLYIKPIYIDDELDPTAMEFSVLINGTFNPVNCIGNSSSSNIGFENPVTEQPNLSQIWKPRRFEKYEKNVRDGYLKLKLKTITSSKNFFQRNFIEATSAMLGGDVKFKFDKKDWYLIKDKRNIVFDATGRVVQGLDLLLYEFLEIFEQDPYKLNEIYEFIKINEYIDGLSIEPEDIDVLKSNIKEYLDGNILFDDLQDRLKDIIDIQYVEIINQSVSEQKIQQISNYIYCIMPSANPPLRPAALVAKQLSDSGTVTYNIPGSPTVNRLTVDYLSTINLAPTPNYHNFYHLCPFGGNADASNYSGEASAIFSETLSYLFLGFSKLKPAEGLSLLFHLSPGTEIEPETESPDIRWSYLTKDNLWKDFPPGNILTDTTRKLKRTGMIQFMLPSDLSSEGNTLLNPTLHWIRATAVSTSGVSSPAALPSAAGIYAQVIEAELSRESTDTSHLAAPLPAYTISKLALSHEAVKKIEQPLPSFNGRLPESAGTEFYRRVSERLRHKDRAIIPWDYERLLLEKYPNVAKALCISHATGYAHTYRECEPGHILISVIPDLSLRTSLPPEPRFSKGDLDEMRDYLTERANIFLDENHIQLVNPHYVPVWVKATISLRDGFNDREYYKRKLDGDLKAFLAPWMISSQNVPKFEQILRKSQILFFIEQLPYVNTVKDFNVFYESKLLDNVPITTSDDTVPEVDIEKTSIDNLERILNEYPRTDYKWTYIKSSLAAKIVVVKENPDPPPSTLSLSSQELKEVKTFILGKNNKDIHYSWAAIDSDLIQLDAPMSIITTVHQTGDETDHYITVL